MWPWEHLAIGYVLYSLVMRTRYRQPPGNYETLLLASATQFPDVIDKPGSWVFGLFASGTSVMHSVLVALPVTLIILVLTHRRGHLDFGLAFGIGYLSHLLGDILYPVLIGRQLGINAVLWPFVSFSDGKTQSVLPVVSGFFSQYVEYLSSPAGIGYVLFEVGLVLVAFAIWRKDSYPGLALVR